MRPAVRRIVPIVSLTAAVVAGLLARSVRRGEEATQSSSAAPARASLIAATLDSGEPWIALRFDVADGWHVYWQNPGESGSAPEIRWTLPPGWRVGSLEWPAPQRLISSGLVNYGYEHRAVLPARLIGGDLGTPGAIRATVQYAACRDVCVVLREDVSVALPLADGLESSSSALITAARRAVPRPLPGSWAISARCAGEEFVVALTAGRPIDRITLVPQRPGTIDDSAGVRFVTSATGGTLRARRSPYLSDLPPTLDGVLVVDGHGSFDVRAPLTCAGTD